MNYKRGLKRIVFLMSIIAFLVSGTMSFISFYSETREGLSNKIELLEIERSLLEEKESEVSAKLREQSPIRLKDLDLIDYYKREISRREKQIPPKAYVYDSIYAFSVGLGTFFSIWIAYYILSYFLIWIINPLMKWLTLGFRGE